MTPNIEQPVWPRLYVWSSSGQWAAIVVDATGNWLWNTREGMPGLLGRDGVIREAAMHGYADIPIVDVRRIHDVPRQKPGKSE